MFEDSKLIINKIKNAKKNGKIVIAEIAPAVRVSLGEEFSYSVGEDLTGELVATLKKLGFDYVVDTPLGADICTYSELELFKNLLDKGNTKKFPIFSSCCVGWRTYAKHRHPELKNKISSILSPNQVTGIIAKELFAKKLKIDISNILVVGIMPCILKKEECNHEFKTGNKAVDFVLTTTELAQWIYDENIDFHGMKKSSFDPIGGKASQSGVSFGASGGVTDSLAKSFAKYLNTKCILLEHRQGDITRRKYKIGKYAISCATVFGIGNIEKLLDSINKGELFHFVEVMQCVNGCVGGPGQPRASKSITLERAQALKRCAKKRDNKTAYNDNIAQIIAQIDKKLLFTK